MQSHHSSFGNSPLNNEALSGRAGQKKRLAAVVIIQGNPSPSIKLAIHHAQLNFSLTKHFASLEP